MIQRFFHPVGQGAFYSERHMQHNINIVYDCGTTKPKSRGIRSVVNHSFKKDENIHILFISHFDKDHISLIDELKKSVKKIERVVIPLLHADEKIFLSKVYKSLGESRLANLVSNPNEFFGEETKVITVLPSSENEVREQEPFDISEIQGATQSVSSGTPLIIRFLNDWVYIPFNHEYQTRNGDFLSKLQEKNIDINMLKTDSEYIFKAEVQKAIKAIYKRISGGINENSMFVYSGPRDTKDSDMHYWRRRCWRDNICCWHFDYYAHRYRSHRVACLYTGDGNLNKVDVRTIYSKYWDLIGTIQIPHHGSLRDFDASILADSHFLCPISVGKSNPYGHPSQRVIGEILSKRSYPILITEDVDSTFIEIIEC